MDKQTIALIDDDRNILTSLSIALEKEGFKVQTYIDGESALIGLTRTPPDLAIIDIKMPKMDGEELLKKLRKKTSLPVIFLTSCGYEPLNKTTSINVIDISDKVFSGNKSINRKIFNKLNINETNDNNVCYCFFSFS